MAKQILGSVFGGVGVTMAATLAMVMGCGGGSGASRTGSGGTTSTGTGGTTTTGTGGAGGSTSAGTGGSSSTTTANCSPGINPSSPTLTTFTSGTDWSNVSGKWGATTNNLLGSIYAYQGSKSGTTAFKAGVDTTAGVLDIGTASGSTVGPGMIAAGDYAGGGLSFVPLCVNTTTYSGVSFTLGGTAGGCDVYFQVQTFDEQGVSNGGGCPSTGSCYSFPQVKVVSAPANPTGQPITVHFADLMGGEPDAAAAIAKQIVGLQFQLQSSSPIADAAQTGCTGVMLTIDDVAFVP